MRKRSTYHGGYRDWLHLTVAGGATFLVGIGCQFVINPSTDGTEVVVAPKTGVTETASTLTGLWFEGKLVIPKLLKALWAYQNLPTLN